MTSIDLSNKTFLVVGDLIVDHYRIMSPSRVSPEAPVLIVSPQEEYCRAGGAANVASNLLALGARNVLLCSAVGPDYFSGAFAGFEFPGTPRLVSCEGRRTTVKERVVTKRQQLLRIDRQSAGYVPSATAQALSELALAELGGSDCLVLSDYGHGVMRPDLVARLVARANEAGVPTVVDSKAMDTVEKYRRAMVALPNHHEARKFTRKDSASDEELAKYLLAEMELDAVGLTVGSKGIVLAGGSLGPGETRVFPAVGDAESDVVDVTGAGDTVTAAVSAGMALGMPYDEAMRFANLAAGVAVRKKGVAAVGLDEIGR